MDHNVETAPHEDGGTDLTIYGSRTSLKDTLPPMAPKVSPFMSISGLKMIKGGLMCFPWAGQSLQDSGAVDCIASPTGATLRIFCDGRTGWGFPAHCGWSGHWWVRPCHPWPLHDLNLIHMHFHVCLQGGWTHPLVGPMHYSWCNSSHPLCMHSVIHKRYPQIMWYAWAMWVSFCLACVAIHLVPGCKTKDCLLWYE